MRRHPFDLVSLVLGVLVLALGVAALADELGPMLNRPGVAIPIAVGLVGLALIVSARGRHDDVEAPGPD